MEYYDGDAYPEGYTYYYEDDGYEEGEIVYEMTGRKMKVKIYWINDWERKKGRKERKSSFLSVLIGKHNRKESQRMKEGKKEGRKAKLEKVRKETRKEGGKGGREEGREEEGLGREVGKLSHNHIYLFNMFDVLFPG